ncbi:pirin family protein [Dactylosporangium sp. CA-139066]|uniref:pirin family protein n=1 Tax=Dactylosporangium sp. CA-139066 TaxID=3239930 RepID=UPI003D8E44A7
MSILEEGRDVPLGRYTVVRRSLPNKTRRTVGAWCFLDHFGPEDVTGKPGMRVPPHPHIGLQTVSWLLSGEVRHRDSLGSDQVIYPGQLNIMTSGRGISHSENSPTSKPPLLHGLQLWVALPSIARDIDPAFQHLPDLPEISDKSARIVVAVGALEGVASPAVVHSELLGADITLDGTVELAVRADFEHAVVVTEGVARVDGDEIGPGSLLYLDPGRDRLRVEGPARLFLLGGVPFEEELVMWWNFVARSHEEIVAAREDWMARPKGDGTDRFGVVPGGEEPLPAPPLPTTRLLPRPRYRRS